MSPCLAFCWPAGQGQRRWLCVWLERMSHYFMLTGLFYFCIGTNIRVFTIFIATREEFLESKGCGKFEETEKEKAQNSFSLGAFWCVHELHAGLVDLQCPLLSCLWVLFPPSLIDAVYPRVDRQLFPQGCWKDGSIEAKHLAPRSIPQKVDKDAS